ncbi:MAG: deoxyribose-phosphate aldolase, partial [Porphyromonas endodontalis]
AYTMCCALRDYRKETGLLRGIKFSGGIRSAEDAVKYYCIVEEILGAEWMTNKLFRIGASSLAGNLIKAISECK